MERKRGRKVFVGFRLNREIVEWLARVSEKTGKTKTRLLEEGIRHRMALKD